MSEEKKPTAPSAGNGGAPIVCMTVRLATEANKPKPIPAAATNREDPERTVIPPERPPQAD
jgi:hypothetical protein